MLHASSISKSTDQIAIIGIGCAFPGGIESPDALWQFLSRGGDAVVEVPADRWNVDAVYDPTPGTPGKAITRSAGLLRDVASFESRVFRNLAARSGADGSAAAIAAPSRMACA
jgi:acyl transferase domain-containing protein